MTTGCVYCDDIDNIAKTLKQDISAKAARQRLAVKEPSLVKKIDNGEKLSDNELDVLWKEENRSDAIDLMYKKDRNLLDEVATKAINSGDDVKIAKTGDEIKKTTGICIRKGECTSNIGAAIGLGAIATVGLLSEATGNTWKFFEDEDAFYEITPIGEYETGIPSRILDAYAYLMTTDIPYETYTEGEIPGIQGSMRDKYENMCQNFVLKAVGATQANGFNTVALSIVATRDDGEEIRHAIMGIVDDSTKTLYAIDPTIEQPIIQGEKSLQELITKKITDPKNFSPLEYIETTKIPQMFTSQQNIKLVDPETGIISADDATAELIGKRMKTPKGHMYTITHVEIIGTPLKYQDIQGGSVRTLPSTEEGYTSQSSETFIKNEHVGGEPLEGVVDIQARIATVGTTKYKPVYGTTLEKINQSLNLGTGV